MVKQYLANVQTVLNRPHVHELLRYGGILWRIVRQYAPHVYTNALMGPSPDAHIHGRRQLSGDGTRYTDRITPDEIKVLLGATSNSNTFWPYPEWYEKSSRYNGEWTAANEEWFVRQAAAIEYAQQGALRGGRAWQHTVRVYKPEVGSDPSTCGTVAHAEACCSHLVREWPDLWEQFNLASFG
jgi:hypothetical protein